jgi:hypothetical protein
MTNRDDVKSASLALDLKSDAKMSKNIDQVDLNTRKVIHTFSSVAEAAKSLNLKTPNGDKKIWKVLRGDGLTAYGFLWMYHGKLETFDWAPIVKNHRNKLLLQNDDTILQIDFQSRTIVNEYKSINDAAESFKEEYRYPSIRINNVLNGIYKSGLGYFWTYKSLLDSKGWDIVPVEFVNFKRYEIVPGFTMCTKCETLQDYSQFRTSHSSHLCASCEAKYRNEKMLTLDGFLSKLIGCAQTSAASRAKQKRNNEDERGICSLVKQDLYDLIKKQNGKCFYSGIELQFRQGSFQCSCERLLPKTGGYTKENVVLICLEFNVRQQWSKAKIITLLKLILNPVNDAIMAIKLQKDFSTKRLPQQILLKTHQRIENGKYEVKCKYCEVWQDEDQFKTKELHGRKYQRYACDSCGETPLQYLTAILSRAKSSARRRALIGRNDNRHICTVTQESLIKMIFAQNGKCAITGITLQWRTNTEFAASLERKNPKGGYEDSNCCFICAEFNSSCNRKEDVDPDNDTNWTKEKFQSILPTLFETCKNDYDPTLNVNYELSKENCQTTEQKCVDEKESKTEFSEEKKDDEFLN